MSRWEPGTRERLVEASLELFGEHGFDATTVAEISERAGLSERTFFRYFTDKREVLFDGRHTLENAYRDTIAAAPDSSSPLGMVSEALLVVGAHMESRRDFARKRQQIIMSTPELLERELLKMEFLSKVIAEALSKRGTTEPTASLTADMATSVFKIAFAEWVDSATSRSLNQHIEELLEQFSVIAEK